jgi:multiple sugar transport system substrate-binding protein
VFWAWNDKLLDVSDVVETQKSQFSTGALLSAYSYNKITGKRSYYSVPWKAWLYPFHLRRSFVEKAGYKISEIPKRWDAFIDFFKPLQTKLRARGLRQVYAYGHYLSDDAGTSYHLFLSFLTAYGGQDIVTADGRVHTDDPKIRDAAVRALTKLTSAYKEGFVPPEVTNWTDTDAWAAFAARRFAMFFGWGLGVELAVRHNKAEYDDIVTRGPPLDNDGEELPSELLTTAPIIPKAAKSVAVAKDFLKYAIQPKVLNKHLKASLGIWLPPMPSLAEGDPFWLDPTDPHRSAYANQALFSPTIPGWYYFNPAMGEVLIEHVFTTAERDVIFHGMAPEAAIDNAFKRIEAIFAKYPIVQA